MVEKINNVYKICNDISNILIKNCNAYNEYNHRLK